MNCSHARKVLYPEPRKSAATIETAAAMEHVRGCAQCQEYFQHSTEWSDLLRQKAGTQPAPERLRGRIARQCETRHPQALASRRKGIIAALIALALLPAGWLLYQFSSARFFEEICEDHAKYLNAQSQVRSPDPAVIESWFRDKTEFGVRVPAFDSAQLIGGRLCFLKKRKAALVFYRKRGRTVSLFQFNGSGISLSALDRAVIDGATVWRASFNGFSLAAFQHRGVMYVLVSDLRESELLELASAARAESRGY